MDQYRALSLFQPSNLNAAIGVDNDTTRHQGQEHLFGALLGIPHTQVARVVAMLGFDFIFVDTLHVPINPETLAAVIQTINFASEGKTCVLVRVPSPDSDLLTYALDAGAAGIIFPQVDTPAQAAAAVYMVRYAYSGGNRSISPIALLDGITSMSPEGWTAETIADRNISVICQIESTLGVENVDAIAKTPGVNSLMIGVADLKATLGLPIRSSDGRGDDSKFYDAVDKVKAASKKYGTPLMIPAFRTDPDNVDWLRDFKLVVTSLDILDLVKGHQQGLANMKQALCGPQKGHQNGYQNGYQNGFHNGKPNGFCKDL